MKRGYVRAWSALILAASLCLGGCFGGFSDAYSLKERLPAIALAGSEEEVMEGFASDLCVVSDESVFDPNFLTSEAGALFDLNGDHVSGQYYKGNDCSGGDQIRQSGGSGKGYG